MVCFSCCFLSGSDPFGPMQSLREETWYGFTGYAKLPASVGWGRGNLKDQQSLQPPEYLHEF